MRRVPSCGKPPPDSQCRRRNILRGQGVAQVVPAQSPRSCWNGQSPLFSGPHANLLSKILPHPSMPPFAYCSHLEFKRPGGRSSQRFGDMVRRRLWRRRAPSPRPSTQGDEACALAAAAAAAGDSSANRTRSRGLASPGAPGTDASAALAGAAGAELLGVQQGAAGAGAGGGEQSGRSALSAYEAEAKKRAMKAFMSLVLDLLQRRRLWSIIPWDPSALLVLYRKHQQVYTELQAQAYERRLFAADLAAPPSRLRPQQRTMLQDVLAAAMHSRAAYGYPMAAGHVSSVMRLVSSWSSVHGVN